MRTYISYNYLCWNQYAISMYKDINKLYLCSLMNVCYFTLFYLDLLPPKPKLSFRYLKQGIQEFHRKYVLAPADNAANNVVVV